MKTSKIIIAIDPDVDKSGLAVLDPTTREISTKTLSFPLLLEYLHSCKHRIDDVIVLVEAGWLSSNNWHSKRYDNNKVSCAKGNSVGRNHETGRKIVEMAKHYGFEVLEHFPLKKIWKSKDGKITHEELASFTGLTKRNNQEERDAALLAWNYARLPIKVKVKCA